MRHLLIQLNLLPGVGSARLEALTSVFPDLPSFLRATAPDLRRAGLPEDVASRMLAEVRRRPLEAELERAERAGLRIVTPADGDYPLALREVPGAPAALYVRGDPGPGLAAPGIAIVGSRKPTPYGRKVARDLARELAGAGVTVISGLARGIDVEAHRGALDGGGRTLAVLGCGLDRCYPREHRDTLAAVVETGAALSEFALGCPPVPANFPRRNRIISGLSRGVVVVEAAERSGSLITARLATEQGREVFAVPGPITSPMSRGPHRLLGQGARLLNGAEDIFTELDLDVTRAAPSPVAVNEDECRVLACLGSEPVTVDRLVAETGFSAERLAALLATLEIKDRVRDAGGGRVVAL